MIDQMFGLSANGVNPIPRTSKDFLSLASGASVCKSTDDSALFLGWSDRNWNVIGKVVEFFNFYMDRTFTIRESI